MDKGWRYPYSEPSTNFRTRDPLFSHSALYRYLKIRWSRFSINQNEAMFASGWLDVYLSDEPAWVTEARAQVYSNLLLIQKLAQESGATFGIVLIPSNMEIDPNLFQEACGLSPHGPTAYDVEKPYREIVQFAQTNRMRICDLRTAFRDAGATAYFKHDRHFNALGHRIAADAMLPFIQDLKKSDD